MGPGLKLSVTHVHASLEVYDETVMGQGRDNRRGEGGGFVFTSPSQYDEESRKKIARRLGNGQQDKRKKAFPVGKEGT